MCPPFGCTILRRENATVRSVVVSHGETYLSASGTHGGLALLEDGPSSVFLLWLN